MKTDWLQEQMKSRRFRWLYRWEVFRSWLAHDVWGWIIDEPCSGIDDPQCRGRRSGKPKACPYGCKTEGLR